MAELEPIFEMDSRHELEQMDLERPISPAQEELETHEIVVPVYKPKVKNILNLPYSDGEEDSKKEETQNETKQLFIEVTQQ